MVPMGIHGNNLTAKESVGGMWEWVGMRAGLGSLTWPSQNESDSGGLVRLHTCCALSTDC